MKIPLSGPFAPRARGGFTFVELLCVMGIMAILLAVAIPSIEGMNLSAGIGQGGQVFADQVALARQLASARNLTVEVRLIKIPVHSANGYSAIQLWAPSTGSPLSRVVAMPDGIAISQDMTNLSTLFATYSSTGTMPAGSPEKGDSYVSFTINPSGMVGPLGIVEVNGQNTGSSSATTEPSMTLTTVGVVPASNAAATTLPKNYVLVQLNPLTAATTVYRP